MQNQALKVCVLSASWYCVFQARNIQTGDLAAVKIIKLEPGKTDDHVLSVTKAKEWPQRKILQYTADTDDCKWMHMQTNWCNNNILFPNNVEVPF